MEEATLHDQASAIIDHTLKKQIQLATVTRPEHTSV
jgi:hypothetical protein